jgi:hypothetical protein
MRSSDCIVATVILERAEAAWPDDYQSRSSRACYLLQNWTERLSSELVKLDRPWVFVTR